MSRYHQTGEWRYRASLAGHDDYGYTKWAIVVEQSDLRDTRSGQLHEGGTYRVKVTNVPGWRTKSFHGESAHHAAARYASDAATAAGDWRWWPDL